jgi:hypothetical protein
VASASEPPRAVARITSVVDRASHGPRPRREPDQSRAPVLPGHPPHRPKRETTTGLGPPRVFRPPGVIRLATIGEIARSDLAGSVNFYLTSPDTQVVARAPQLRLEFPWSRYLPAGTGGSRTSRSAPPNISRRPRARQIPQQPPARGALLPRRHSVLKLARQPVTPRPTDCRRALSLTGHRTPSELPGHSGTRHPPRCIPITLRPRYRAYVHRGQPDPPCPDPPYPATPDRWLGHRPDRLGCRSGDREGPGRRTAGPGPTAPVPALAGQAGPTRRAICP